jgi:hypothetical protein
MDWAAWWAAHVEAVVSLIVGCLIGGLLNWAFYRKAEKPKRFAYQFLGEESISSAATDENLQVRHSPQARPREPAAIGPVAPAWAAVP